MKYQQDHLFDPAAFDRPVHPGEKDIDSWLATENVAYHGTFRGHENTHAPTIHLGSEEAATKRLNSVQHQMRNSQTYRDHYYDPSSPDDGYEDWGDNDEPDSHVGQLKAYRMQGAVHEVQPTMKRRSKLDRNSVPAYMDQNGHDQVASADANANAADMHRWARAGHESWEIPRSIQQSSNSNEGRYIGPDIANDYNTEAVHPGNMTGAGAAAARALDRGDNIAYANHLEGKGEHSFVAPTRNLNTWESDVLSAPHASTMSKQFAAQRQARGQAGSVSFVPDEDETPSSYGTQLSLFGNRHGVTLPVVRSRQSEFRFTTERE